MNILSKEVLLTFDDVLLSPRYSEISSRNDVDISVTTSAGKFNMPVISANMDTITEYTMALAMARKGALGIFHRFITAEKLREQVGLFKKSSIAESLLGAKVAVSVGVDNYNFIDEVSEFADLICVDVAHGHCLKVLKTITYIKNKFKHARVIGGNIATVSGARDLVNSGADWIKVGIGNGSACTTRLVTGHGVPQLSAISNIYEYTSTLRHPVTVVADGGIRHYGDIAKCLAAGADMVMLGGMLSGTEECPGDIIDHNGKQCKIYRGMASREVHDKLKKTATPEGVSMFKASKGSVSKILDEISGGLRSAFSYSGSRDLESFKKNAEFIKVSPATLSENYPHGLSKD